MQTRSRPSAQIGADAESSLDSPPQLCNPMGVRELKKWLGRTGIAVAVQFVLAGAPLTATAETDDATAGPMIPPGQENLLLEMLGRGASLPDKCKLTEGQVAYVVVEAKYTCSFGEVVLSISHSSQVEESVAKTETFAIAVVDGSPTAGFTDAVASLIRSRENDFEWVWPAQDAEQDADTLAE